MASENSDVTFEAFHVTVQSHQNKGDVMVKSQPRMQVLAHPLCRLGDEGGSF